MEQLKRVSSMVRLIRMLKLIFCICARSRGTWQDFSIRWPGKGGQGGTGAGVRVRVPNTRCSWVNKNDWEGLGTIFNLEQMSTGGVMRADGLFFPLPTSQSAHLQLDPEALWAASIHGWDPNTLTRWWRWWQVQQVPHLYLYLAIMNHNARRHLWITFYYVNRKTLHVLYRMTGRGVRTFSASGKARRVNQKDMNLVILRSDE